MDVCPMKFIPVFLALLFTLASVSATAEKSYSPPVDRNYPDNVYWGDTHLHTYLSGDAYSMGTSVTPDQAYRFAKGETVRATGGDEVRLKRPLDFMMVADHAENLGALPALVAGDAQLLKSKDGQRFREMLINRPALPDVIKAATQEEYDAGNLALMTAKGAHSGNYGINENFKRKVWHGVIDIAEKHNDPGRFTTFAGYEYSSNPPMLHRNVLYLGDPEQTRQTLPFSKYDSSNPEDLWAYLQEYKDRVGGDVISIPHNSNLSQGNSFRVLTYEGEPLTTAYARLRSSIEPIVEVTQIKGDSETHPFISPDDEFADYESWGKFAATPAAGKADPKSTGKKAVKKPAEKKAAAKPIGKATAKSKAPQKGAATKPPSKQANALNTSQEDIAKQSYVRPALKSGLELQAKLGVNPFKMGMIGATDSHTGLATADEDNFWGKMGSNEPGPYRSSALSQFTSSGYAAVWATENTREAIFAAMKRREVYASTGPRIKLRFFGGWDYSDSDALTPNIAAVGYEHGVPMGGDLVLTRKNKRKAPSFLIRAVKDPDNANLDRVQVIKGWRDRKGKLFEKVYDVAWSDDREQDKAGKVPAVGSTVDLKEATYLNSIGSPELSVVWTDPDFDSKEAAFYYVRVIQIPTPRWTTYDAKVYGLENMQQTPAPTTQERAYSSPIWYTP
jgi:hypothetical protein